jgi:hypothetical protein
VKKNEGEHKQGEDTKKFSGGWQNRKVAKKEKNEFSETGVKKSKDDKGSRDNDHIC